MGNPLTYSQIIIINWSRSRYSWKIRSKNLNPNENLLPHLFFLSTSPNWPPALLALDCYPLSCPAARVPRRPPTTSWSPRAPKERVREGLRRRVRVLERNWGRMGFCKNLSFNLWFYLGLRVGENERGRKGFGCIMGSGERENKRVKGNNSPFIHKTPSIIDIAPNS